MSLIVLRTYLLVLTLAVAVSACGPTQPEPEVIARTVYTTLLYKPPVSSLHSVYRHLDARTRQQLDQRAAAARSASGVESIQPWDMIGYRELLRGDRVDDVTLKEASEKRATVLVTFAWYVIPPTADSSRVGGDPLDAGSLEVSLVREEDGWKVVLPLTPRPVESE